MKSIFWSDAYAPAIMPPLPAPTMSRSVSFVSVMSPISGGAPSQSTVMAALPSSTATALLSATPVAALAELEALSAPVVPAALGEQPARPMAASAPTPATPPRKLRREMPPSFVTFVPMMILLMVRFVLRLRMRSRFPRRALYGVRRGLKPPRRGCFGWRKASWRAPPARVI